MDESLKAFAKKYPDKEDRAFSLLAEGARLIESILFGEGKTLTAVQVFPDEEDQPGYHISVIDSEDIYAEDEM